MKKSSEFYLRDSTYNTPTQQHRHNPHPLRPSPLVWLVERRKTIAKL